MKTIFDNIKSFQTLTVGLLRGLKENIEEGDVDPEQDLEICDTSINHIEILFNWGRQLYRSLESYEETIRVLTTMLTVVLISAYGKDTSSLSEDGIATLMGKIANWAGNQDPNALEDPEIMQNAHYQLGSMVLEMFEE